MYQQPQRRGWLDKTQDGLSMAGFIPGFGAAADLINAGIYGARGKWGDAGFSAFAALPGIGDLGAVGKWGKKGLDAMNKPAGRIAGRMS